MLLTPHRDEHALLALTFIYQREPSWSQQHFDLYLLFCILLHLSSENLFFSHIISAIFLGSICYSFHLTFPCCLCIMRKMCHMLSISNYVGCSVNEEKPIVNYHNILFSHTKKLNACDLPEHLETTDGKSETGVEPEK